MSKEYYNAISFVDPSRAGKSTLINYLVGHDFAIIAQESIGNFNVEIKDFTREHCKIGHDGGCTLYPLRLSYTDSILYDCPGFYDDRGIAHQI